MRSRDITVTKGRTKEAFERMVTHITTPHIETAVQTAIQESRIRLGTVTKFYPYKDKAEVQLRNDYTVLCKLPHMIMGDFIDFFVPTGEESYCNDLKEPCVIPRDGLPCIVLNINDDDSADYFLLSYYTPDDLVSTTPPREGHVRWSCLTATNECYIDFSGDGIEIVSTKPIDSRYGEFDDDLKKEESVKPEDVYSKDELYTKQEVYNKQEVYTKEEVDELIRRKIVEALGEDDT